MFSGNQILTNLKHKHKQVTIDTKLQHNCNSYFLLPSLWKFHISKVAQYIKGRPGPAQLHIRAGPGFQPSRTGLAGLGFMLAQQSQLVNQRIICELLKIRTKRRLTIYSQKIKIICAFFQLDLLFSNNFLMLNYSAKKTCEFFG